MTAAYQLRQEGWRKGQQEGISQGAFQAKLDAVKSMLSQHLNVNNIAKLLSLDLDEVLTLKQRLEG